MRIPPTDDLTQATAEGPSSRTTYARAVREYDEDFKRHLVGEIVAKARADGGLGSDFIFGVQRGGTA